MREISLDYVKKLSFDVLNEIHNICESNGITYSLTGGTLLGAVRHKGFIPWDDDIDITMPRDEYNKFLKYVAENHTGFKLISYETESYNYPYLCAKACYPGTVLIENGVEENSIELGVYVDIFPVDGVGNNFFRAKLKCKKAEILNGLRITANWKKYQKSSRSGKSFGIVRYFCYLTSKLIGKKRISKMLQKCIHKHSISESKFSARLGSNLKNSCILPTEFYYNTVLIEFEGKSFRAFSNYNKYLSIFFGDYMTLPSPEMRVRHHNFRAYIIDKV